MAIQWHVVEAPTYESVRERTTRVQSIYARDKKHISNFFHGQGSVDFHDLDETMNLVRAILRDLEVVKSYYEVWWKQALLRVDRVISPVYTIVYRGSLILGFGSTGAGVAQQGSESSGIAGAGLFIMAAALGLSFLRGKAMEISKEMSKFQKIYKRISETEAELEAFQYVIAACKKEGRSPLVVAMDIEEHFKSVFKDGFTCPSHLHSATKVHLLTRVIILCQQREESRG